jgi:TPP-dependent pyruvate/acetoin dehydrogenase alpha subunit
MALIRRFEEEAGRQYQRAKAGGFLHLAIGEEATILGTTSVMRETDYLIGTYRTHGHAIARGMEPKRVMAELFGRVDGTSGGRGGSMHMFDGGRRFMGGDGIVGGNLPISAGLALSSQYKGEDAVTVCVFGDGASNTGNFGETMNLAALWSLPIVFLVENNLYGMGTAIERHSAVTDDDLAAIRTDVDAEVLAAVEFADASPEPPLDSLYDNLYVVGDRQEGWYAVDERTPDPFRGEREREAAKGERVRELHEAGAAYGGQHPRSGGGSGQGPVEESDDPAEEAQQPDASDHSEGEAEDGS